MRILSLHPITTELVFALGAGHHIVGRCEGCDYPEVANSIPSIGGHGEITVENIKVFEPDLILISNGQDEINRWFPGTTIKIAPDSLETIYTSITSLGTLLEKHLEADMLVHEIKATLERIHNKVARFHTLRVYCEQDTAPPSLLIRDLIGIAGAEVYDGPIDVKKIQSFDPHIMLFITNDDRAVELVLARNQWSTIGAVQRERILTIEEGLLRPTPRLMSGAKRLAKLLHGVEVNGV
ncbi:TPA: ABC transporter substrate-binding protein [Candidatus Woesearchaeota archaeon]|nr:ABC transporter substrate-binding protein [Candidatus Woesearchaeota archaeon]